MTGIPGADPNSLDEDFDDGFEEQDHFDPGSDFGDEADDGGDDAGGFDPAQAGGEAGDRQEVRQPSRAQARVQEATRRASEAEREAATLRQQMQDLLATQNRQREQDDNARIAQMEPWERAEYLANQTAQRTSKALQSMEQRLADTTDRAEFSAQCAGNPMLAKIQDRVEEQLAESRKNGVTIPRRTLAAYLLGEQLLTKAPAARARAEKRAATNVNRERARPVTGGSDAPAGRASRDDATARRQRLENASI